ncbi:uncharacterized protein LOC9640926 [Selaginella moellendorffii]|uniref:uncharacterized protein LOC9640926 n=1 Tax=Selaginella moellendorffii TaxID=88036 RepID=UPI000D1C36C0|nr:uncharacterized protein LOC9640926 [Selaginella moellendorffii]|eukprot:XP_024522813.1 uncharacterized protein LOC9640926 [Selaginella moellendorffii]
MAMAVAVFHPDRLRCSSSHKQQEFVSSAPELVLKKGGHNYWQWQEHKIHYVRQGHKGVPILLVHGFGASVYHWRYNIPELAKTHEVFALDLLGFGWSDKALIEYDPQLWSRQIADFVKQVVKRPAVIVGNSIGGLTSLQTAVLYPDLVAALALVNPAGRFQSRKARVIVEKPTKNTAGWPAFLKARDWARREALLFVFKQLNQRSRIQAALNNVYRDKSHVDEFLIDSILEPAADPNAAEVFYRMISRFLFQPSDLSLEKLLRDLDCPLLVLWGESDPLAPSSKADKIQALYNDATLVKLQAGHCPHDEIPTQVNERLALWIASLENLS